MGSAFLAFYVASVALLSLGSAALAQNRDVRHCLAIANVDERVECMEGRSSAGPATPSDTNISMPRRPMIGPSFDCRAANTSVEVAICNNPVLAELDLRMGEQFKQVAAQNGVPVIDDQRRWLSSRNARCGALIDAQIEQCLIDLTRARIAALLGIASVMAAPSTLGPSTSSAATASSYASVPTASPTPPAATTAQAQGPQQRTDVTTPQPQTSTPKQTSSPESTGASFWFGLLVLCFIVYVGVKYYQKHKHEQALIEKYGELDARRILSRTVWTGMTDEQLREALGPPVEIDSEVKSGRIREIYKYNQTGKNRFRNRVTVDNGLVSGWKTT